MTCLVDSNVLIAAWSTFHPHHSRAVAALVGMRQRGDEAVAAAHSVAETYCALTGMPRSPRVSPERAHEIVSKNLRRDCRMVALDSGEYFTTIRRCSENGIAGAAVYDAVIAEAARKASVGRILTFNVADFRRVAPDLDVAAP